MSKGYPGDYEKNKLIRLPGENLTGNDTTIFHAGTKLNDDGSIVTNGGRVLAVTSFGRDIADAVRLSAERLNDIYFDGMYFRRDIGYEFRNRR